MGCRFASGFSPRYGFWLRTVLRVLLAGETRGCGYGTCEWIVKFSHRRRAAPGLLTVREGLCALVGLVGVVRDYFLMLGVDYL